MIQAQPSSVRCLEDFFAYGEILLGPRGENFLSADFWWYGKSNTTHVESDRGVGHILMLLHAELLRIDDAEEAAAMLRTADIEYPYGMTVQRLTPLERMALRSAITISLQYGKVHVWCKETGTPPGKKIAGLYRREAYGHTVMDALEAVLQKEHILETPSSDPYL